MNWVSFPLFQLPPVRPQWPAVSMYSVDPMRTGQPAVQNAVLSLLLIRAPP
jgi:hypothetical protein